MRFWTDIVTLGCVCILELDYFWTDLIRLAFPVGLEHFKVKFGVHFTLDVASLGETPHLLCAANPDFQIRGLQDPGGRRPFYRWPDWPKGKLPILVFFPLERDLEEDNDAIATENPDGVLGYLAEMHMWRNLRGVQLSYEVGASALPPVLSVLRLAKEAMESEDKSDDSDESEDSGTSDSS